MKVLTESETLALIETLKEDIRQTNSRMAQLEAELRGRPSLIKMPDVQRILKLSWTQVKTRMDKGIIPYSKRGEHYQFVSSDIYELARKPEKLTL